MPFKTLLILCLTATAALAEKTKIVCFGDSITKRGYPALLAELTGTEVISSGVAGHNSLQGLKRIQKDVLDHHPDIVVVFFGTNDIRVDSDRAHIPLPKYEENLTAIAKACRKAKAQIVICTPPPIDPKPYFTRHQEADYNGPAGLAKLLSDYRDTAIKVAKKNEAPVVDLNQLLLKEPTWMHRDGVHPSPAGNKIIASLIAEKVRPLLPKE
ncbi:MAG: SGNH/GDSL hydrolase family protein [Verrucomicrobiaceae bacterium]